MKIKAAELKGKALSWAVAKCYGALSDEGGQVHVVGNAVVFSDDGLVINYQPWLDWSDGGPIIESMKIKLESGIHACSVLRRHPTHSRNAQLCDLGSW